jgi:hypothetical protein
MVPTLRLMRAAAVLAALMVGGSPAMAEEGMWTFDAFPSARVKAQYGFAPDKAWLDRVQKATARLENGCSGSVLSKEGLVLTNHHCIEDCASALSSARRDLLVEGFLAADRKDEKGCPGLAVSILQSITDVTAKVRDAVKAATPAEVATTRAAAMAAIETEACGEAISQTCQVVTLYRGGQYKLYRYEHYDDVRLAFAPEMQAAFFGGDPDNFNYPRYAYDMALVRLYRDGRPAKFSSPLKLSATGPASGDLVFVPGNPGSTERLLTVSQLAFQRDHFLPWRSEYLAQLRGSLLATFNIGEEEARQTREAIAGVENSYKVFSNRRAALADPALFAAKVAEEKQLRDALAARPDLKAKYGDPFADIDRTVEAQRGVWLAYQMLEVRLGGGSTLLTDARTLLRNAAEAEKPAAEKLPEFAASRIGSLSRSIGAQSPLHPALETLEIEFWLLKTREVLGPEHPAVKALFGNRSAIEIARDVVANSRLSDPNTRKRLWGTTAEAKASNDPAIAVVRAIDAAAREARKAQEQTVDGPASNAAERIANLRFDVFGDSVYPDATFTPRLSYGVVQGWNDPVHGEVAPFTHVSGLWARATGAYPFDLVPSWSNARSKLDPQTQMNFVSTTDIIGGNSGSPVLNSKGDVIGLAFDGNIHSIGGAYGFDAKLNRTVSLSSALIVEGLRKVYGARALADELAR